ncbi:hypothetical protein P872_11590 [Rhodonellum psychrophilum GCM71 = DSM 17998]|uniref:Uncharacterized protein n=1 Tax=Rhodonellum psychrophilum GCM71 = DSM 17998 TaxID=1123057 RepID=U5BYC3_9BACT|nr:hypothetical protein P872_11590 [Rhodonellum psychrophilum GCM71 = DSM 17998]
MEIDWIKTPFGIDFHKFQRVFCFPKRKTQ